MNNWFGSTFKQVLNDAMNVEHYFEGFDINTTAYCLGQYSLHLLLPKSSKLKMFVLRSLFGASKICFYCIRRFTILKFIYQRLLT